MERCVHALGVDVVLNSLAEEKLQASIRCIARHGRFLEIGKYDLANNSPLGQFQPSGNIANVILNLSPTKDMSSIFALNVGIGCWSHNISLTICWIFMKNAANQFQYISTKIATTQSILQI